MVNRTQLVARVRSLTRDFSNSIFRQSDIIDYINEAIERFKQIIPELANEIQLTTDKQEPTLIPSHYQHLLAVYTASRCFGQDERHYQATTFMNEFETKLEELRIKIESGEIKIVDENGDEVITTLDNDYVVDNYFLNKNNGVDIDNGVEGI